MSMSCRCSLDPSLLWLWCRPAATALIQHLAWELQYAALKTKKKKKKRWGWNMLILSFSFFSLFRATSAVYGSSHARGQVAATAASLCQSHSNAGPSYICNIYHSSRQCRILNPLRKARDWTHILRDISHALNLLSHNGSSLFCFLLLLFLKPGPVSLK